MKKSKTYLSKKMSYVRHITKHNMSLKFKMTKTDGSEVYIDNKRILQNQQKTKPQELLKKELNSKTGKILLTKKLKLVIN